MDDRALQLALGAPVDSCFFFFFFSFFSVGLFCCFFLGFLYFFGAFSFVNVSCFCFFPVCLVVIRVGGSKGFP